MPLVTKEEFTGQVELCRGTLYRVSCAYLIQEADRLDAVQEALLKAWKCRRQLKEAAYFRTWLTRILIRECVNIQRRQKRMIPTENVPEDRTRETPDGHPELRDAILRLPEKLRIPLVLHYMEGCPVEEIARILHVPKGTVCSRLSRARDQIRIMMKEEAPC